MGISINGSTVPPKPATKKRSGHTQPQVPQISLHEPGRLRVAHMQALLGGISHSAFYSRLALGRVPKPDGHDPRPYWKTETAKAFLQK